MLRGGIGRWLTLWVSAVGSFLLGVWEGLNVAMNANNGPGPQCGAIAVGRFYHFVVGKMVNSLPVLVTMAMILDRHSTSGAR